MKERKILSLRALRKERGWTQQKVAEKAGVNLSNYNSIENGRGKGFKVAMKHSIADVFGVNMLDLFPEEREKLKEIFGKNHHQLQMFIKKD
ncbi:MAG: helix-turn-helix transcriptional regulator [Proteobacteria bacterium]|nr:helix-turn-helix transcriptional regulator [Pseudomonadota bacterium]